MSASMLDSLQVIAQALRTKNDIGVQKRAAASLQSLVTSVVRESPSGLRTQFMAELRNIIHDLVNSASVDENKGGVLAISVLVDVDTHDNATKIARFANYLKNVLPCADASVMEMAAKTLGRLAQVGGTLSADIVEFEVSRAFDWLSVNDRNESRRHAAVLLLRELSIMAPTLFYVHVASFFDLFSIPVTDPKLVVREVAVEALASCLRLISSRQAALRADWLSRLFEEAMRALASNVVEAVHGALLTLAVLLDMAPEFMESALDDVAVILSFQSHKSRDVRRTVLKIVPKLALFRTEEFIAVHLKPAISEMLQVLKSARDDRDVAFVAVGEIARVVRSNIAPFLDAIFKAVTDALTSKKNSKTYSLASLECIAMLAEAMGSPLTKRLSALLDPMFLSGLSQRLVDSLASIAAHLPELLVPIQERLLDMLSLVLKGTPHGEPGAHASAASSALGASPALAQTIASQGGAANADLLALALETLGRFDFAGHVLSELVRFCVVDFLEHDVPLIRRQAVLTCCSLLVPASSPAPSSGHESIVVAEVLEKLIVVGIADPVPDIRQAVLASLDWRFDFHLAQAEVLRSLFIALKDEEFAIRELAIKLVGRLTMRNPAYVMPALRKTLIQLLTELEFSGEATNKEESAQLLAQLIASSHRLIKPYVSSVIRALLPKLTHPDSGMLVGTYVLAALGELAVVAGEAMLQYTPALLPLIIETLYDQSSLLRRKVAMRTLGQLCQSTGFVVAPYVRFPSLLNILLAALSSESSSEIRSEIMKVLGIIGALDPYRRKLIASSAAAESAANAAADAGPDGPSLVPRAGAADTDGEPSAKSRRRDTTVPDLQSLTLVPPAANASLDEYHARVAIKALIAVLSDPTLAKHHKLVVSTVMQIFSSLGVRAAPFLPQIMPPMLDVMRSADPSLREALFQHMSSIVATVKHHIREYLDELFDLILEFWDSGIRNQLISLVEEISVALADEFKVYLPKLIPHLLRILHADVSDAGLPRRKALAALEKFGTNLEDYLHLVVPAVVRLAETPEAPLLVRAHALQVLGRLCRKLNFSEYASRIVLPLARILACGIPDLARCVMETLCDLVLHLGSDFAVFIPMINKTLHAEGLTFQRYDALVSKLLKGDLRADEDDDDADAAASVADADEPIVRLAVNESVLQKAWEASQRSTKEDWLEWIRKFSVQLLKSSSSPSLRACWALAQVYPPLAKHLFNAAFLSCWTELFDQYRAALVRSLQTALCAETIPAEILQQLLNLAEFMEHNDSPLSIPIATLGHLAEKCRAYAKALHYKEIEFRDAPEETIEALISINNQLGQPEAAEGILLYARINHGVVLKSSWYEKLHRWEDALAAYDETAAELDDLDPSVPLATATALLDPHLGRMRCLSALGEWESLAALCSSTWAALPPPLLPAVAPMATAAAWNLSEWAEMDRYVEAIEPDSVSGAFYRAVLALHSDAYAEAQAFVNTARELLDTELTALVSESYDRAYPVMVQVMQLAEMEEVIVYKQADAEQRSLIKRMWASRLAGCQRSIDIWQRVLAVRSLVLQPRDDLHTWLSFAELCRDSGRMRLSYKSISCLLDETPPMLGTALSAVAGAVDAPRPLPDVLRRADPAVAFAYVQHVWQHDGGSGAKALYPLSHFASATFASSFASTKSQYGGAASPKVTAYRILALRYLEDLVGSGMLGEHPELAARAHVKLGEWLLATHPADTSAAPLGRLAPILSAFEAGTVLDPAWYRGWHAWARINLATVQYAESVGGLDEDALDGYLVASLRGFFQSLALGSSGSMLQDALRVLTLWFKHGHRAAVESTLFEGFGLVSVDTWLCVIPQLIARIHASNERVRKTVVELLTQVGKAHPQALVYPLTVASKSQSAARRKSALVIVNSIKNHSPHLIEQAETVADELIRVAILWYEMWHEALEEASRLYFGDHDVDGMFATLADLHTALAAGAESLREISFQHAYGRELAEASEWCERYKASGKVNDLNAAWDLYYRVFRRIDKQLAEMKSLDMKYVSPFLERARDLELPVPGTYAAGSPVVRIAKFGSELRIISSKQRPRKISILGSDGGRYEYLLKGHEDLRQDERVMQLFGLVNTLLQNDPETARKHLGIIRYDIVPLSPYSGLLGWVPNTDTLHALVKEYRDNRNIPLNLEMRTMLSLGPAKYETLTLMQKVELFEAGLASSPGDDLYKVLWLKSPSSESWLERRTNYTRSLAVMSMVGYILGLGDRHPSNIMFDRVTGKVLHIDYGDCFEVAMLRDKWPEKVPFRLTPMLVAALEVSKIEGNYRFTCESVMSVLRLNKDALMSVLEAFVHDPLINWRLIEDRPAGKNPAAGDVAPGQSAEDAFAADASPGARRKVVDEAEVEGEGGDELNERAVQIVDRISDKLSGRDFGKSDGDDGIDVPVQVDLLIRQAMSHENLSRAYAGWCCTW